MFHSADDKPTFLVLAQGGWQSIPAPASLAHVHNPALLYFSPDEILIAGGRLSSHAKAADPLPAFSASTLLFNWRTGAVVELGKLNAPRENLQLVHWADAVYAIGGAGNVKNENEVLDLKTRQWKTLEPNAHNLHFGAAFVFGEALHAVANNFVIEVLQNNEWFNFEDYPLDHTAFLASPKLLTPLAANLLLLANDQHIYVLDLKNLLIRFLFKCHSHPLQISAHENVIEVLDSGFTLYRMHLGNDAQPVLAVLPAPP